VTANRIDFPLLKSAQQLGLQIEIELADFIKEQRATIRGAEAAERIARGASESALYVPEELTGEEIRRKRCAVHRDKRLARTRTLGVDCAGHQFLARAAGSFDQDMKATVRDL
jgi:hypothetical protein